MESNLKIDSIGEGGITKSSIVLDAFLKDKTMIYSCFIWCEYCDGAYSLCGEGLIPYEPRKLTHGIH